MIFFSCASLLFHFIRYGNLRKGILISFNSVPTACRAVECNCLWHGNSKLINGFCPSGIFRQLRDNELTLTFKGTCVTLVKIRNLSVKGLLHYLKCTYMQDTTRITELSSFDVQIFCSINRFKNLLQITRGEI